MFSSETFAALSDSGSSTPKSLISCARSATYRAQSRMTVRIVPSTGRAIAEYADSAAFTTAAPKPPVVTRGASGRPSEKPQKNWARIAPELPRAPPTAWSASACDISRTCALAHARDAGGHLLERRGDVGPGVAVGHREDVDLVEGLGPLGDEVRSRDHRPGEAVAVEVADRDHGLIGAGNPSGARPVSRAVRYSSTTAGSRSR